MQIYAKKLPSGKWRARAYDYTDKNGKRHYVSFTSDTKSAAQTAARAHKPSLQEKPTYSEITLRDAYKRYVDTHSSVFSPSTIREYTNARNRDYQELMPLKLKDITPELVQTATDEAAAKFSPKTVRDRHGLLHKILKLYAPYIHLHTDLPRSNPAKVYVPTTDEVQTALDTAPDLLRVPILLASRGSLRRSEICALTFSDFTDFGVQITKAMVKDKTRKFVIKPPKTESGTRFCPLPPEIINECKNFDFSAINPDKIERLWQQSKRKNGFNFKFHAFRHYWASLLHEKGIPDQYIAKIGGWATIDMLHRVYAHALRDKLPDYTAKIVNIFDSEFSNHRSDHQQQA